MARKQGGLIGTVSKCHLARVQWPTSSGIDDESDAALAIPFAGLFEEGRLHGSAVILPDGSLFGCELTAGEIGEYSDSVMVVGDNIRFWSYRPLEAYGEDDLRNQQAFGEGTISLLRSLRVAVIGCSGTGSVVMEQLARLGVGPLVLIDPDPCHVTRNHCRITHKKRTLRPADDDNALYTRE